MRPSKQRPAFAIVAALLLAGAPGALLAQPLPKDRAGLDAYIREYLLNNPEVVRDALVKLQTQEELANTKRILQGLKDDLYAAGSPEIGNPDAKIAIVEFYDYNCPYCRATYPKLKAFLAANPDTKLVLKDVASLGKDSEAAARVVIAAAAQKGDIAKFHDALMTQKGKVNEARALDIAGKLGYDTEQLKKDAQSSKTGETLTRTQTLADRVSVSATPLYVIGHNGIQGAPDDFIDQVKKHVEEVRESGCDVC